ncbi:DUF418 domain-containing protein [Bacillus sp. 165]|uniref:DUF418 domain-containing protein n=1 Tax=Bacillus sp. 165 TaxID=1529117 RepID=UPI001ADB27C3|nr:DUF418 domain-containing protein [Bacillus sp. 165]MBO9128194.1 DUF418 domain-containing protein [Bacillus sp. 165]
MSTSALGNERIYKIDMIRGFAVFGIFLVNWPSMVGIESLLGERTYSGMDAYFRLFYDMFIQTKFYTIFSFLFGLSFYLFMIRATTRVNNVAWLFSRRLFILFLFGLCHFVFLWYGDILHTYAIAGFFLLPFYRRNPKMILVWSIILLSLFQLLMFLLYLSPLPANANHEIIAYNAIEQWTQDIRFRFHYFTGENIVTNIIYLPEILGLFLLGLYTGKKDIFRRTDELRKWIRTAQIISFMLTVPSWYMIASHFITSGYNPTTALPFVILSGKTLAFFYVTTFLLITDHEKVKRVLVPFQYVGRMALTSYISQTVITTFAFALLFENTATLHLWQGALYCLALYTIQALFCKWWLKQYQFGPLEYIWRVGTYGKRQLFRRKESDS